MDRYEDPDRIYHYSYNARNDSLADRYLLKYWWKLAIKAIPEHMSPNLVSMLGNIGSWFSFLILSGILFGPMDKIAPTKPWVFGLATLGIALYQTFDALDGIQARRVRAAGPLGEFIDHWFDSFNVFLIPLGLGLAFADVPAYLCLLAAYFATVADWSELRRVKETNTIHFGKLSSEEGQILIILLYLVIWISGYSLWARPLAGIGISLGALLFAILVVGGFIASLEPLIGHLSAWLPDVAAEFLTLAPIGLWAFCAEPRLGRGAIIAASLCIGFGGSRHAGDLLRSRLFGLANPRWYADLLAFDALLVLSVAIPGLPGWAAPAAIALYAAWILATLAIQFKKSIARVRACLGVRLFSPPPLRAES